MKVPKPVESLFQRVLPAWVEPSVALKAASFAIIGCINAAVDFSIFAAGYFYFGLAIIPANLIAWCVAASGSYVLNTMITFAAESGRRLTFKRYLTFAATQVGGLIANTLTVFFASYFMPVMAGKVLAIGASFVVNFSLSHLVVFRGRETPRD